MNIALRVLLLTLLSFGAAGTMTAQTTWTGSISAAWNTAGNWSAGVPDAADDIEIPNVTNDPVISTAGAVAKSVTVQTGGLLTINATGTLTLNGAASQGILNNGTVKNSGTITVSNITGTGNGVLNYSIFDNLAGGTLNIDGVNYTLQNIGLYNLSGATFTNTGAINIGASAITGQYGLDNSGTFNNSTSGVINLDRSNALAIRNNAPFTNAGIINIGSLAGGTNMTTGISNAPTTIGFTNAAGGQINIDRVTTAIEADNFSTFNNSGTITIGAQTFVSNIVRGSQTGKLNNNTGGIIKGASYVESIRLVNAGGTISPGTPIGTITFNDSRDFNNGILAVEVNGTVNAGTHYDQVNLLGSAALGGTLALTVNHSPLPGDEVVILKATSISGSFTTITGLPAGWNVVYSATDVKLIYGQLTGTVWTGAINADWENTGNWTNGVPDAADSARIPNVTIDPVISSTTAIATGVIVENGATLTISNTGSLTLNSGKVQGILNQGTVQNNGTITIGNLAAVGTYGIRNEATFNNNTGAVLNIDRTATSGTALYNVSGAFTNAGAITIGTVAISRTYGIQNDAIFTNNASAQIIISRTATAALYNATGTFTNAGTISIGTLSSSGQIGVQNNATFNNNSGQINIDWVTSRGINNVAGIFNNAAVIAIGAHVATITNGLYNTAAFNNNTGASIAIDRISTSGTALNNVSGAFTNAGTIVIGSIASAGFDGIDNTTTFNNNTGGQITIDRVINVGIYHNGSIFTNQGSVTIGSLASGNVFEYGIYFTTTFNNTGGQINIDRVRASGTIIYTASGSLNNTGAITLGALTSVTTLLKNTGSGIINNNVGGIFKGAGSIASGRLVNAGGTLAPGTPIGKMTFTSSVNLSNSILAIEIAGAAVAGTDFDQLEETSGGTTVTLGGALVVSNINSFMFSPGQSFVIIAANAVAGTFTSVTWPTGVTGTVTYSTNAVTLNILTALPLTLVEFNSEAKGNNTLLTWKTADEENTAVFEVERSNDGVSFTKVGTVAAMGSGAHSYSFIDEKSLAGNNYYRLKMVDKDGQFTYSKTGLVKFAAKGGIQVAPVPANSYIQLTIADRSLIGQRAQVYSTAGILITNVTLTNSTRIDISNWPNGMYNIKTSTGTYRFIKQ